LRLLFADVQNISGSMASADTTYKLLLNYTQAYQKTQISQINKNKV